MGEPDWGLRVAMAMIIALIVIAIYYGIRRLLYGSDRFTIDQTRPHLSRIDETNYRVHEGHADPQHAADMLAQLNGRVIALMRHLRNRYIRTVEPNVNPARRAAVAYLLARYNPDNLAENSPKDPSGDTAYSTNKGAVIALCLRDRIAPDAIHDLSILTFVTLHEMTHIAIDAIDHPPEFWRTFRFLLEAAEEAGIFTSPHYVEHPVKYCGVLVNYTPRWDAGIVAI
jgi:hypothetical protein